MLVRSTMAPYSTQKRAQWKISIKCFIIGIGHISIELMRWIEHLRPCTLTIMAYWMGSSDTGRSSPRPSKTISTLLPMRSSTSPGLATCTKTHSLWSRVSQRPSICRGSMTKLQDKFAPWTPTKISVSSQLHGLMVYPQDSHTRQEENNSQIAQCFAGTTMTLLQREWKFLWPRVN